MSVESNYNETFVARLASRQKQMQQHLPAQYERAQVVRTSAGFAVPGAGSR